MPDIKLTSKQKEVKLNIGQKVLLRWLQNGAKIYVSRFSNNMGICGTDKTVTENGFDFFFGNGLIEYTNEDDIRNYYAISTLGNTINID